MGRKYRAGFTLVELLVVIGIIAVMVSLLLPALVGARRASQKAVCTANLKTIGNALRLYALANKDFVPNMALGTEWIQTYKTPSEPAPYRRLADWNKSSGGNTQYAKAYWGAAFLPYIASKSVSEATGDDAEQIIKVAERFFRCPSSVSTILSAGSSDPETPVSYGVSTQMTNIARIISTAPLVREDILIKLSRVKRPSETIFCHDSLRPVLRGTSDDSLTANGTEWNLQNYRQDVNGSWLVLKQDALFEFYRHSKSSNTLWYDGHVDSIRYSSGKDIPPEYYAGWK